MTAPISDRIDIRSAATRFNTQTSWLDSHHSFAFSHHRDPANTHHGLLLVSNDDIIQPETGFETHPHRDMEIITWVLRGELEHKDSEGHSGLIYPGLAQRMSAGSGIWHSEMNATPRKNTDPDPNPDNDPDAVHLVQMWVIPDTPRIDPSYQQLDINTELDRGGLVPVASGRGHDAAISIRQQDAVLWAGRLRPNEQITLPDADFVHLYIALGSLDLLDAATTGTGPRNAAPLNAGDAVRLTAASTLHATAGPQGAEILVWEMASTFQLA